MPLPARLPDAAAERADYGAALIRQLAAQLARTHGKGYSISNSSRCGSSTLPIGSGFPP